MKDTSPSKICTYWKMTTNLHIIQQVNTQILVILISQVCWDANQVADNLENEGVLVTQEEINSTWTKVLDSSLCQVCEALASKDFSSLYRVLDQIDRRITGNDSWLPTCHHLGLTKDNSYQPTFAKLYHLPSHVLDLFQDDFHVWFRKWSYYGSRTLTAHGFSLDNEVQGVGSSGSSSQSQTIIRLLFCMVFGIRLC